MKILVGQCVRVSAHKDSIFDGETGFIVSKCTTGAANINSWYVHFPSEPARPYWFLESELVQGNEKDVKPVGSSRIIDKKNISPYHTKPIQKGVYGELSKIIEEADELKDAQEQDNPILVLNELADIVGAIDGFVNKHHGMGIDDVIKMMRLNEKAFKSGHRR